jgi:hypothetical protein
MNKKIITLLIIFFLVISGLYISRVDNTITFEDKIFIRDHFIQLEISDPYKTSYEEQLNLIQSIQHSVFHVAPVQGGIDKGKMREPKDLFMKKTALCHDRSRVIEKILRYYGFKTRHISIYSTNKTDSFLKSLITPGIDSHALTEVKTSKGWLVVDSNKEWVAIDYNKQPISIAEIINNKKNIKERLLNDFPSFIFNENFFVIYGLYSRHGMFYPPFNFVPDINYPEFTSNFQ